MQGILTDYFQKQEEQEHWLERKYPWAEILYNWVIAACVIALFIGFIIWGINIHIDRKTASMTELARASWEADLEAAETAKAEELAAIQASQEFVMQQEATAVAKAFYGIRLFVEKYHYTEADLATYARCMFNRAEGGDLISVISAKDQFVGYADGNAVLTDDYNLALRLVEEWHNETTKPCDVSYQFAELTPNGIYLKNDLHADGYAIRWKA